MEATEDLTQQALDKLAIMELPARYMRGLDRLDRDLLRAQFWDDAWMDYGIYTGGADGFADFCMEALSSHVRNHHIIGQNLVEIDGDQAYGEVYFQAYHRIVGEEGEERDVVIAGRYVDRYQKRAGIWKFAYRSEVVDWARDDPAADAFLAGSGNIWGERKPDDSLYQRDAMKRPAS
ncbi:MAG: nuclear transport factor 2 family protein [Parasphingorhabdus sp.]